MKINQRGIAALEHRTLQEFVQGVVTQHIAAHPRAAQRLGTGPVHEAVSRGVRLAQRYGIDERSPLTTFLRIQMYLGARFDCDPMMGWAQQALVTPGRSGLQSVRVNALRKAALAYLDAACGADGAYLRQFLVSVQAVGDPSRTPQDIFAFFGESYPAKSTHAGPKATWAMIEDSAALCRDAGLDAPQALFTICTLRMAFGHGVTNDPMFPWVAETVRDPLRGADRAGRLWSGLQDHIAWVLAPELVPA